ncbi:4-carboxymuconolactone decarboxylase [Xanthomonas perforans]|uniref:4-carboxymuconolactone decarboxylase n=1 Tax=Xanthomonas perforans TaxID=442694 RepID=A0A6P0F5H1_XANPE|nr:MULTISPECIES: carboxymuconolactone decarboxylase family protein [Xanthomonas]KLC11948.1 4-carboxymuconolactone decarboxylase [Xanthomonas perforans]KLC18150.1 4-carboxymuconolactone decarboxylase [Xanthomonas perforans]KLC29028.1 4-carboxymuconolactone decarboxylase [Xanthomonas perforans]KLC52373.1 4-carboxymuconolactone decarboxylase [Xanthomonas perforans]KLC68069.1 4-carboxymuconolactone decarboxylase [Xanthomonas perforans]
MKKKEISQSGLEKRASVLGEEYVNRALQWSEDLDANEFQRLLTEFCWAEVWSRNVLPDREKSLVCLGMLIASGRQFELTQHFRAAMKNGLTKKEIMEVIIFSMPYAGVPLALEALKSWGVMQQGAMNEI